MLLERKLFKPIRSYLETKEAIIITGMRRTGKTSLLRFIYERIPSTNKIFLDLENPLNQKYFEETNYDKIKSTLEFLGLDFRQKVYLFLDEIQLVRNLPRVVKYLIDQYKIKCFLTGSASFYLRNLFTESLVGRKYIFELFPLDFEEFLLFKNSKIKLPERKSKIARPIFDTISNLYDEYIYYGGFPEVVLKTNFAEKKKSLEDIFTSYFQLEILRLGDFRKNEVIRDLILLLLERIGAKLDINKISSELGISRITVKQYISFLEGTYFIKLVRPFSRNRDTEIRKIAKVYFCDSGLVNHFSKINEGSLFENNIFQNLRMRGEINYYQKKSGVEIDFILNKETGIEVKINPTENDVRRLEKISKEIRLKKFKIFTKNYPSNLDKMKNVEFGFFI
jgi:hypothetical protein